MSALQHTPLPWSVQNKGNLGTRGARHEVVQGNNVDGSRNLPTIVKMPDLSTKSYKNAAFIVQACNLHYDLIVALQLYLRIDDDRRAGCEISPTDWAVAHQSAQEALAKAKRTD